MFSTQSGARDLFAFSTFISNEHSFCAQTHTHHHHSRGGIFWCSGRRKQTKIAAPHVVTGYTAMTGDISWGFVPFTPPYVHRKCRPTCCAKPRHAYKSSLRIEELDGLLRGDKGGGAQMSSNDVLHLPSLWSNSGNHIESRSILVEMGQP